MKIIIIIVIIIIIIIIIIIVIQIIATTIKKNQLNFQAVRKKISQSKTSNGAFLRKHLKAKSR